MGDVIEKRGRLRNRRQLAAQAWDCAKAAVRAAAESMDAQCVESMEKWRAACARENSAYQWWTNEFYGS